MKESNLGIYACPSCRGGLEVQGESDEKEIKAGLLLCKKEGLTYPITKGIPQLILPSRKQRVDQLVKDITRVRDVQGLAIDDWSYYLHLPYPDKNHTRYGMIAKPSSAAPLHRHWLHRSRSFEKLYDRVRFEEGITLLDLGAGSGWLSNRLSNRFDTIAMDIDTGQHALGASKAFLSTGKHIERCQGELANIPLKDNTVDVAILNSSAEYEDLSLITSELNRVLKQQGAAYIVDSPVFESSEAHGKAVSLLNAYYEILETHLLKERHQPLLMSVIAAELKPHFTVEILPSEHPLTAAKRSLQALFKKQEMPTYPIIIMRKNFKTKIGGRFLPP